MRKRTIEHFQLPTWGALTILLLGPGAACPQALDELEALTGGLESASKESSNEELAPLPQLPAEEQDLPTDFEPPKEFSLEIQRDNQRKDQLEDAQERYLSYMFNDQHRQAETAAEQVLKLATQLYGSASATAGYAHANLANAQFKLGKLQQSRDNYQRSIAVLEKTEGQISPQLINPLMGLATVQNALGNFDRGLLTNERALRINHVELGLKNPDQMIIRDGLTESHLGLGDLDDANFQQEIQARIARDEYGSDLEQLMPAMYKLAEWYRASNQPEKETLQLQNTVRLIRKTAGNSSTDQIRALRGLASAYQRLDMPAEAVRTLKQAMRLNSDSEYTDPLLSADIQVEIGDYYNSFGDLRDAGRYYGYAWQTLMEADAAEDIYQTYFGKPVTIWSVQLPYVYPSNSKTRELLQSEPDQFADGFIMVEYVVNKHGRADDIRIIESDPPSLMDKRVKYLMGRNFYRPRFVDGAAVVSEELQLRHNFSYLRSKVETEPLEQPAIDADSGRLEYPGRAD
jgi:hypothetical protein